MNKLTVWLIKIAGAFLVIFLITGRAYSQAGKSLTINQAYDLARKNYPLTEQLGLIARSAEFTVANAAKGYLPVFSVNGQATYQSAVTSFPFSIPGFTAPEYSRDQYRFYTEADQLIYDGGVIKNEKETAEATRAVQQQSVEVELYALYDRVNQLFFGALLADEELKENDLLKMDIRNGINKAKALVANGVAYRSSVDELSAQLMQAEQARVELASVKTAFLNMLGYFLNEPVNDSTVLVKPDEPELSDEVTRPELLQFDYQQKIYDLQGKLLNVQLRPHISFFVQGGYARPGLNMLSNNFEWYYLGGLRFNWNLGSLYTLKNQRSLLDINRQTLQLQKETFLFNTTLVMKQQSADVNKYRRLIMQDDSIIDLRESVKKASYAQLENGVLSAHDYITEVNAEDQARQSKITHEVQLLQSKYSYKNTVGDIKK
ncbi:MAG TPA: TolC family protein [Chitinophagaceae bacterium]|nr:TolC family protein [Chitinophagaceae bacterium]